MEKQKQKIDPEVLNKIQFKVIDKVSDYAKFQNAGFTKQAEETRQYIHGMTEVLSLLGYNVEYTETGKAIIVSFDE